MASRPSSPIARLISPHWRYACGNWDRPEFAVSSICTQVGMEGVILIDINNVGRPVNRAHVLEEL